MASKAETVVLALKAALETATSAVYEPDLVQVVQFWPTTKDLPVGVSTVYLVKPGQERGGPGPESCTVTGRLEVYIVAARRDTSPSKDPFKQDPERWKVSLDLTADVHEKLRLAEEGKLGNEVVTLFDGPSGDQISADHEFFAESWVAPEFRTVIQYRYAKGSR